jgi:hypothetical protein
MLITTDSTLAISNTYFRRGKYGHASLVVLLKSKSIRQSRPSAPPATSEDADELLAPISFCKKLHSMKKHTACLSSHSMHVFKARQIFRSRILLNVCWQGRISGASNANRH